ncbi:EAL domain-containing protein [Colwellia psychrerythraea]|uniref:cyclic-guanylate-specific phosphodiesterase n=1 Tax=Colwellia psychrerythraea TaxID=28229 RepID=A0A099KF25_COLPS|nr:EAL domain-containing protein [Colwellia psychrerythraea]KGJ88905.1 diguanylate cyclase/phosphodiesterase with PAS/PAC sensor(s) [Colwellia psychrerythraea]
MDTNSFIALLYNAALLISLGVIYDALKLESINNKKVRDLTSGLLVGLLGLAVMNTSWELAPGMFFDTRWVLISLCGLFFGLVPTLIAGAMMVSLRLHIGGAGILVGSLCVIIPGFLGYIFATVLKRKNLQLDWFKLYSFGMLIQITVLGCMLLMPEHLRFKVISAVIKPIIFVFPICTMVVGLILSRQRERRKSEYDLIESQKLLSREQSLMRGLIGSLPDLISFKDVQGRYLGCNHAFEQYVGLSEQELKGKKAQDLKGNFGPSDTTEFDERKIIANGKVYSQDEWVVYPDGSKVLHETIKKTFDGLDGTRYGLMSVSRDITERKNHEEQIQRLAFYDSLTQLPNRRMLQNRLQLMVTTSANDERYNALFFIDLDHFKTLNDTQGHNMGDQLLIAVAARIQNTVRDEDIVARLGGDEFVALISNLGDDETSASHAAEKVAEKIRLSICQSYKLSIKENVKTKNEMNFHCTPSIGISLFKPDLTSPDEILKQADVAMYQAKAAGRNAIRFFDPAMQIALEENAAILAELHQAIDNGELELYYQIQIDEIKGIQGAEVLLRWFHPIRGMVSPIDFIPLAEESGLIIPIGRWVLESACHQLTEWENIPGRENWQISVNVSALQFQQENFVEIVEEIIVLHNINPRGLKLELTESIVLENIDIIIEKMHQLNQLGIDFSMDDFGTGYSSLSCLKRLPLKQLKIDQSFVRDITTDPDDAAIVQTIINLSNSLKYDVIAEGVETQEQRQFLFKNGCSQYQGYLFSRPVPITEFEQLISVLSADVSSALG